jgi:uncharacterized protein YllA (UPF0747 family)
MHINFQELPGMPQSWLSFASTQPRSINKYAAGLKPIELSNFYIPESEWRSPRTEENVRRLQRQEAVPIIAAVKASLLGGPLSQFLKCLTAIQVSEELARQSIPAVPVCLIRTKSIKHDAITILDGEGELCSLSLNSGDDFTELISRIVELGRGTFDPEVLLILKNLHADRRMEFITARVFSEWMKEWGIVALHPLSRAGEKMPDMTTIIGPEDLLASNEKQIPPDSRPSMSATILDSRSRRVIEKYKLGVCDLFAGEEEVFNKFKSEMPRVDKLSGLRLDVESAMAELEKLASGDDFLKIRDSAQERIIYQIDKLRNNLENAVAKKLDAARRQLHKTCNFVAPNRRLQERELTGIYFLFRYSGAILSRLYEQLDWDAREHQLIAMD